MKIVPGRLLQKVKINSSNGLMIDSIKSLPETNVESSSVRSNGMYMRKIPREMLKTSFTKICLKIIYLKWVNFLRENGLTCLVKESSEVCVLVYGEKVLKLASIRTINMAEYSVWGMKTRTAFLHSIPTACNRTLQGGGKSPGTREYTHHQTGEQDQGMGYSY